MRTQQGGSPVQGIAFADGAQINLGTGRVELNPVWGKQFNFLIAHTGPNLFFFRGRRGLAAADGGFP